MNSKYIPNTLKSLIIGIMIFGFLIPHAGMTQSKERTRLRSYFYIQSNGDRMISFLLTAGRGRNMKDVSNASISLEVDLGDSTMFLTELVTNQEGNADLLVESAYIFPADEEGITTLIATFAGNDTLRSADTDLEIKDVYLDMSFEVEDSVKILTIVAKERNGDGDLIPVEELDIEIGVQRLYSVLPLDDIETNENGVGILEFPNDIPGDSIGMLTVVVKIDEHDYFGTVTKSESIDWGIPVSYELKRMYRQLFTDEAPLWMIIGVFIALVGAWYHFFLSVFKLYKLKKAADNSE